MPKIFKKTWKNERKLSGDNCELSASGAQDVLSERERKQFFWAH